MVPNAAWEEFKPFHCEIGVVRATSSGMTHPDISIAQPDFASSSCRALEAPAAMEKDTCVVRSNPSGMNGQFAVSTASTW